MKKALAIVMALVIALSMSAMAFAETPNKCGKCNSTFTDNEAFAEHVRECEGTTAAPTAPAAPANKVWCDLCNNGFENENAFNDHLDVCCKTHNVCPKCYQNFADENAYNDHIAICTYGDEKDYIDLTLKDILTLPSSDTVSYFLRAPHVRFMSLVLSPSRVSPNAIRQNSHTDILCG